MSGDEREARPRLSWREIDQRRSGARPQTDEPRGRAAEKVRAQEKRHALEAADSLFAAGPGGPHAAALATAMRDAAGSAEFGAACRAYADAVGIPKDPALLSLLLDSGDGEIVIAALERLLAFANDGSLDVVAGLKGRLRVLARDRDDTVAGLSEDLLACI